MRNQDQLVDGVKLDEPAEGPASRQPNGLEVESLTERRLMNEGQPVQRGSEEQIIGFCGSMRPAQQRPKWSTDGNSDDLLRPWTPRGKKILVLV
jgi:hypothetical protein